MKPTDAVSNKKQKIFCKVVWKEDKDSLFSSNVERPDYQEHAVSCTQGSIWASLPSIIQQTLNMAQVKERKKKSYDRRQLAYGEGYRKLEISSNEQISPHNMRTITYERNGSKKIWKSRQKHLRQIQDLCHSDTNAQQSQTIKSGQPQQQKINRFSRYFHDSQSYDSSADERPADLRCYRCGKLGHISRVCSMKPQVKCPYCLGEHTKQNCKDIACSKCCEVGHMKKDCRTDGQHCSSCKKIGHSAKNCGKILISPIYDDNCEVLHKTTTDTIDAKCLNCQKQGHFNCHKYENTIPQIYDQ